MKIALDIGHANGTGARGNGLEEHAVSTVIVNHLAPMLGELGHEVHVIDYPTKTNKDDLNATVPAINAMGADISVSIHCDSSDNQDAKGAHVCFCAGSTEGKKLAQCIADPLCQLLPGRYAQIQARPDKAKQLPSLYVLSKTRPPAVLCECGFITNTADASILRHHAKRIAQAIANGVNAYSLPA